MPDTLNDDESLAAIGVRVRDLFANIIVSTQDNNFSDVQGISPVALVDESQRFDLWALNLGLYKFDHSSLDYRFRDATSLQAFARKLLLGLEESLMTLRDEQVTVSPTGSPTQEDVVEDSQKDGLSQPDVEHIDTDDEDFFDGEQDKSISQIVYEDIVGIIDRLYKLAFRIRNPATRLGFSKALAYQDIDEDSGVELIHEFSKLDLLHLREVFGDLQRCPPQCFDTNFLVQRLANANTRRRQQFRYWRDHKLKLEGRLTMAKPQEDGVVTSKLTNEAFSPSEVRSTTTATRLEQSKTELDDNVSLMSASTNAVALQRPDRKNKVSPLPKSFRMKKEFECPYCFILCSRHTLGTRAWE